MPTNAFVVSFRGSSSIQDYLVDASFAPEPCPFNDGCGTLHQGFLLAYQVLSP